MRLPRKVHRRGRWLLFHTLVLSILLAIAGTSPAAAQKKPDIWKVEIEAGKKTTSALRLINSCTRRHKFKVLKSPVKYLSFLNPTSAQIEPGAINDFNATIDATMLTPGVYRTAVFWNCPNCKSENTCKWTQEKIEMQVEITVIEAKAQTPAPRQIYTLQEIVSRFSAIVTTIWRKEAHAEVDADAEALMEKIINDGAETFIRQDDPALLPKAEENLRVFCRRAVEIAKKPVNGQISGMSFAAPPPREVHITSDVIRRTKLDLCPLFPFC